MSPKIDPKAFGLFVAKHREGKLSQAALANAVGISRPYLTQIENGRMPSDEVMQKLIVALGVPMGTLVDEVLRPALTEDEAEAAKALLKTFDEIQKHVPPEGMLQILDNVNTLEEMAFAAQTLGDGPRIPIGPEGWTDLTREDQRLVQRIVNRLRKNYQLKEEPDDGDSSEA